MASIHVPLIVRKVIRGTNGERNKRQGLILTSYNLPIYFFPSVALVTLMAASAIDVGSPVLSGSESRLIAVLHFTFLVGFLQLGLGIFRMGAIVHYVSEPVLTACSSVGIVITVISQLKYMLGINVPSFRYTFQTLRYITFHLSSTN